MANIEIIKADILGERKTIFNVNIKPPVYRESVEIS